MAQAESPQDARSSQGRAARWIARARQPDAWAAFVLLLGFVALVWTAAAEKSEIIDEGLFIGGGALQLSRLDTHVDVSHPPLPSWLAGLSATLFGGAEVAPNGPAVPSGPMVLDTRAIQPLFDWSVSFFYNPAHDKDAVVFWGRFPFALLGAAVGLLVFVEARRRFGLFAGLSALALCLFTPELLAHSQWAHSDVAGVLATLIVTLTLAHCLEQPSPRSDLAVGAALGLALLVKYPTLLLVPLVLVLVIWRTVAAQGPRPWLRALGRVARIGAALWLVVVAGYLPEPRLLPPHELVATDVAALVGAAEGSGAAGFAGAVLRWLPLPDSFIKGMVYTRLLSEGGQVAFFHGEVRSDGWWHYFPVAVALKYPTALLALALGGLVALCRSRSLSLERKLAWTLPPALFLGAAMAQKINIGVRSVLVLAPFVALWSAAALAWAKPGWRRTGALVLVGLSVYAGLSSYPHFLGYFNRLAGGPRAAHLWLADSNLDWGQDLPALARSLQRRGIERVRLAYFGAARPEHWRIRHESALSKGPGWYAISRTHLSGMWPPGDPWAWLRGLEPVELVGSSIALYRVEKSQLPAPPPRPPAAADAHAELLAKLMSAGLAELDRGQGSRPRDALDHFMAALALKPDHYGARYQSTRALEQLGHGDAAAAMLVYFSADADAVKDADGAALAAKRLAALTSGQKPWGVDPKELRRRMGSAADLMAAGLEALHGRRAFVDAAVDFVQVLRLAPDHYGARYQLANALDHAGLGRAALAGWRRFVELATADSSSAQRAKPHIAYARQRIAELQAGRSSSASAPER